MEKKNTMLLTVIAVATLLVAVVGATFAFFSLQVGGTSTTDSTVTAAKVGTATISTVEANKTLKLSLTADDMAKYTDDKVYYASVDGTTHGNSNPIDIANISYSGGEEDTTYSCPVQVEVSVSGSMYDNLDTGWTQLILQGDAVNQSTSKSPSGVPGTTVDTESNKLTVDLKQALSAGAGSVPQEASRKVTYKGNVTVKGPDMDATNILKASLSLTNKNSVDQSKIADSELVVTIAVVPNGACTLQPAPLG